MDSGLEHPFDLGLVNYHKHPSDANYVVYRFRDKKRADHFEQLLVKAKIWYERSNPEADEKEYYLIAVHKKNFSKTQKLNYETEGKFKKPLIKIGFLRYFFVLFMIALVALAALGYCRRNAYLEETTRQIEQGISN